MYNISSSAEWKRPFTNKRYLHPPFAENMFTMWPELRVICGDIIEKTYGYRSSGFRILVGEDMLSPDFKNVTYETRNDGIPIHSLSQYLGQYSIHMESFCSIDRIPTCYTKFTLENNTDTQVSDVIAILPRTGREDHLVGTEVDGYAHYDSNVHNWGFLTTDWRMNGNLLTDGDYNILLKGINELEPEWQEDVPGLEWYKRRLVKLRFSLNPKESISFFCAFRHGEVSDFEYEDKKNKTLAFWQGELKRLKVSPGGEKYVPMVSSLVCQCLQM
ncbi:MAG: hypothetical protein GX633_01080, partial [Clostridiales bacterium]|nr:hypothetical protein [Clostridiales bacterium]